LTSLMPGQTEVERTETTISSLMDTWIVLGNDAVNGRHHRGLYVLKSRGMAHSNDLREFALTDHGLHLREAANGGHRGLPHDGAHHALPDDGGHGSREGGDRHAVV